MTEMTPTTIRRCLYEARLEQFQQAARQHLRLRAGDVARLSMQPYVNSAARWGFYLNSVVVMHGDEVAATLDAVAVRSLATTLKEHLEQLDQLTVKAAYGNGLHDVTVPVPAAEPAVFGTWVHVDTDRVRFWLLESEDDGETRIWGNYDIDETWAASDPDYDVANKITDVLRDLAAEGIITSPIGAAVMLDPLSPDLDGTDARVMVELDGQHLIVDAHAPLSAFLTEPAAGDPHPEVTRMVYAVADTVAAANRMLTGFFTRFKLSV